jgi:hypothetical protein
VVAGKQHPVGDKVPFSEDFPHSRQQEPSEEQLFAEHRVEEGEHDDHREPAPRSVEEILATVAVQEHAEIPRLGSPWSRHELLEGEEHQERQQPPPDPSTHAAGPWIAGCPQPQGVTYTRPTECPQLEPGEDHDEHELQDEPHGEEEQQRLR